MINKYLAMGLGALIAVAPVVASVDAAQASTTSKTHMSSHKMHKSKSHMASKSHKKMSKKTMTPEAPKS
jgi:hypothetical protein